MSRHIFDTKLDNNPVRLTVGYDRPTGRYFFIMGWIDPEKYEVFCYASGLSYDPSDLKSIRELTDGLGVLLPESLWREVAYDAVLKSGFRVVRHLGDGRMRVLLAN